MVRIKVCGITQKEDALRAVKFGATAIGFIFYKKSPRCISPSKAKKIIEALPPFVTPVGVFVNEGLGKIRDVIKHCQLGAVQLHGDEDHHFAHRLKRYNAKIIKAFRVGDNFHWDAVAKFKVDGYLFDTYDKDNYGGTGKTFDWKNLMKLKEKQLPIILSGGLNSQNVIEPVNKFNPYAVDVNSGVESEAGKKDVRLLQEFCEIVQYISHPANRGKAS